MESNFNPRTHDGDTPLSLAAQHGRVEIVEIALSQAGVEVKEGDSERSTPFAHAATICWERNLG
ncbi:hypothetical protein H105_08035 [Trichophyton soudanense CBS 452.61]|uniref:Uncharacterized protein n=1 Tax=Trichophyton soudanense CBS 452.61 TaxID=1215331 RepID=A0A022XGW8_TRISD|nr:hypothetical protein H105_08035 [Trichophyton soudanense CBS 452.61]EZG01886.1 hypothetical protein H106_07929 [Trichophyton rubrum CBS 735.88]